MKTAIRFDGIDRLRRALDQLPDAADRRILQPAARAAAQYIAQRLAAGTPRGATGNLASAPTYRQSRGINFGLNAVAALFKIGYRAPKGAHALIVDQGTGERVTKAGASRGRMPANPYFDRLIAAASEGASLILQHFISRNLAREADRFASGQLDSRGRLLRR